MNDFRNNHGPKCLERRVKAMIESTTTPMTMLSWYLQSNSEFFKGFLSGSCFENGRERLGSP